MDVPLAPHEALPEPQNMDVHAPMDVPLAPQEASPAPQEAPSNVNAVADAVEYIFQYITVVQDYEALK